ncbi:MAG: cytochrome ubiquinol oxidase subunit I, partial [Deferribacterota bacterium]|nr:cytochrome ubiquinol oxidase subunit I [Deferribacterota bacterium]
FNYIHPAILISSIATFHVFIAQFSIGMGLYVIINEYISYKTENNNLLNFTKKNTSLIIFIATILGAVTGVGIWFTISIVAPRATSELIHNFVWFWATEWVFFLIEIISILLYYYLWNKISKNLHLTIGAIYFIAGWFSLFLINGIISFQLTPGNFHETNNIWHGFFNPSFLPSTIARTGFCLILASIYSLLVMSFTKDKKIKKLAGRISSSFIIIGFLLTTFGSYGWIHSVPTEASKQILGGNLILSNFFKYYIIIGVIVSIIALLLELIFYKYINIIFALILLCLSFMSYAYFEFSRERVRKPYVIYSQIYSNGITVNESAEINKNGILQFINPLLKNKAKDDIDKGGIVFRSECYSCHSLYGFNDLKSKVGGLKKEDIYYIIDAIGYNPLMPTFLGTDEEKRYLSKYLEYKLNKNLNNE